MLVSDRHCESRAREVIQTLIPVASVRQLCLEALGESITLAHKARPSSWGVTLFPNLIRLNVGMIEVFVLSKNHLYLILDLLTADIDFLDIPEVDVTDNETDIHAGLYRSVPESIGCEFPAHLLPKVKPLIWAAHEQLIKNASVTRRHPMTRGAYSPGVLDYLRNELKYPLPEPIYSAETGKSTPKRKSRSWQC